MADTKHQQRQHQQGNRSDSAKPESASKPGKHAYDDRTKERTERDKSQQDNERGDRKPVNLQNNPNKGGQR